MKMLVVGILIYICGGFTLALLGAILAHKSSWGVLAVLFFAILGASALMVP